MMNGKKFAEEKKPMFMFMKKPDVGLATTTEA